MYKLRHYWQLLRSSFWFIPALMVALSVALAMGLIELDLDTTQAWSSQWPRLFGATPEGARELLGTIAGSMMTVMGVTFSMTLVALTLASSQYTSRSLRNFMRSRVMQSTLGVFAGIFTYCLIVLRSVRGGEDDVAFVPSMSLFVALILALVGIGFLIYFIHHIALSIQASSIIASVSEETLAAIHRLFPSQPSDASDDEQEDDPATQPPQGTVWQSVPAKKDGYIQAVDLKALIQLAQDKGMILRMERGIGAFVVKHTALASLAQEEAPDQATTDALNATYTIARHRTVDQDPAFGIRQLVDIAIKALSPGVNDTSTAVICIDYLAAIMSRLAARELPSLRHHDDEGTLRVIAVRLSFEGLVGEAFDQIRRCADGNIAIMARLLTALEAIASQTQKPRRLRALRAQVQHITELADRTIPSAADRATLELRLIRAREALKPSPVMRRVEEVT